VIDEDDRCFLADLSVGDRQAARLGIQPWVASYRLDKAVELKFAEKVGGGFYRVTDIVPEF
jgi:hypothetical protein